MKKKCPDWTFSNCFCKKKACCSYGTSGLTSEISLHFAVAHLHLWWYYQVVNCIKWYFDYWLKVSSISLLPECLLKPLLEMDKKNGFQSLISLISIEQEWNMILQNNPIAVRMSEGPTMMSLNCSSQIYWIGKLR